MAKGFVVGNMKVEAAKCQGYEGRTKADLAKMHEKLFQPLAKLCSIWNCLESIAEIDAKPYWIKGCIHYDFGKYDQELRIVFKGKAILSVWYEYTGEYGYCEIYLDEHDNAIQEAIFLIEERVRQCIKNKNEKADINIAKYELNKDKQFEFGR